VSVVAIWSEQFSVAPPAVAEFPAGLTIREMRDRFDHALPSGFDTLGEISVDGQIVPRAMWPHVRLRGDDRVVRFSVPVRGGDEGGGKQILATLGAIALTIATGGIAGGALAKTTLGGYLGISLKAGSIGAYVAAGVVSIVGSNILSRLTAAPTRGNEGDGAESTRNASATGNVLQFGGGLPRVYGERRVFPPFIAQPLVTFDGADEIVEAVVALAGPHRLQDIRIGSSDASDMTGVEIETREGWAGDADLRLVQRFGRTVTPNVELRGHVVQRESQQLLDSTLDVSLTVPQPQRYTVDRVNGLSADEYQVQIGFPQGLGRPFDTSDPVRVPLRIRIRESGGEWRNLPEVHFRSAELRLLRATIRLVWENEGIRAPEVSPRTGWVEARIVSPGQTVVPETTGWVADAYFDAGSGDDYLTAGNVGSTAVQHVYADDTTLTVNLDPVEFPPGRYEVEILRGCGLRDAVWSTATYTVSGNVRDLFGYSGTVPTVAHTREGLSDTVAITRCIAIWNRQPIAKGGMAIIAVRARNVALESISVLAGGYVRDDDEWVVTSNPALHLRDVYETTLRMRRYDETLIDDDDIQGFREHCDDMGYEVNAVLSGSSFAEATRIIAGCGYGQVRRSERMGVVWDRDTSEDAPVQMVTPRNSADNEVRRSYRALPDGLRVRFDDEEQEYAERSIIVLRDGIDRDAGRYEEVRFEGVTTEAAARARAEYEMAVYEQRASVFSWKMPVEALLLRRGSLVAYTSDQISDRHGFALVTAGGDETITLDTVVPLINEPRPRAVVVPFRTVGRIRDLGLTSGCEIRRPDGTVDIVALDCETGESDVLVFADALVDPVVEGTLIAVGPHDTVTRRLLVQDISWQGDEVATIEAVPEAPEIWQ
jgi:hypothetical protein